MLSADTELRYLKGVGPHRAEKLREVGLETVEDLLYVLPFRYEDRRAFARIAALAPLAAETTLAVRVVQSRLIRTRRPGFTIFQADLEDESGSIRAIWYNQPYLERLFVAGRRAVIFGRPSLDRFGRDLVLENPDYEFLEEEDAEGIHTGRIVPVYRKLADLSSRVQRNLIYRALEGLEPPMPGPVPDDVAERHGLLDRSRALREVHFPAPDASLEALSARTTAAQRMLAFEEIFLLQLALAVRRHGLEEEARGISYDVPDALKSKLARLLPFRLTEAQKRVLREIGADLRSPHPMHRLLQGDVGSGKTIVALLTILVAVENGCQGALMVPTEILADQHYRNIGKLLDLKGAGYRRALLTGSTGAAARRKTLLGLADGTIEIAVGTHALFEPGVEFRRLALVVVDEQHRFGVLQRAALAGKGGATGRLGHDRHADPAVAGAHAVRRPRPLGDRRAAARRTPVKTLVRGEEERGKVYDGIRREVRAGRQAYVVVPLVEETEKSDLRRPRSRTTFERACFPTSRSACCTAG